MAAPTGIAMLKTAITRLRRLAANESASTAGATLAYAASPTPVSERTSSRLQNPAAHAPAAVSTLHAATAAASCAASARSACTRRRGRPRRAEHGRARSAHGHSHSHDH